MPHASVYVLASLISGASTALILASGPSYTEPRSPQGTVYDVKQGQSAYDGCRTSPCQIAYLNSVEDFCLWAPSQPALSATRNAEHTLAAWCMKSTHGTRIPDGTISGAHLVVTPEYVQITGVGKLTNMNVPADGVASASGQDHRVHSVVFTSAYGQLEQVHDWTSFVSQERFCFRACKPSAVASTLCPEIRDVFGCLENVPGNYDAGVFEECVGDAIEAPSTLYQEILAVPLHHSAHPFSSCTTRGAIVNAQATRARRAIAPVLVVSSSHSQSASMTSSMTPTATDIGTTITFPSFPTSPLTTTTFMNTTTSGSPSNVLTSTLCSYNPYPCNHTHTDSCFNWHSLTHSLSHHHCLTSTASFSLHSFSHSSSSSTESSLSDPPSTSSVLSPSMSSVTSFILTFPISSPSDPSSGTPTPFTSTSTPTTPASTPTATASFPSSAYETSSSLSGLSLSPSPSYASSTLSSATTPASSSPSPSSSSSTLSQSSYVFTFTTPSSSSDPTTSPTSSSPPVSPSSSSTSSQDSYVLTFTTPSASTPTPPPASSSPTVPNSQTQIGSLCPPPLRVAVNAGSVISVTPLLPLMFAILMIMLSSSVGVLVL